MLPKCRSVPAFLVSYRVINGKVEFSVTFPGLRVDFSTDNGTTWNELIRDDNDAWGDRKVMHLRSRLVMHIRQ